MTPIEYLIGTCLGCKKCLYCADELSIRKKMCSCDKTIKPGKSNRTDKVKIIYPRISTPQLSYKQLEYIQESVTRFGYSLDLNTKFHFTLCTACNSAFQRKRNSSIRKNKNNSENNSTDINETDNRNETDDKYELEVSEKSMEEQIISFNLVIKSPTGPTLPSKWLEVEASSLDDILADVHYYVGKLTGDKGIMHSDYSVSFKPEKTTGVGAQLVDTQDYKKFLLDYKDLLSKKKNMVIVVSLKKEKSKKKQKRKVKNTFCLLCLANYVLKYFIF
jgi:hypothetical protein